MQRPVEIHFHELDPSPALQEHIRTEADKLDRFHPNLTAVIVYIERPHRHRSSHAGWKISIEMVVPGCKSLVVSKSSDRWDKHDHINQVVNEAFKAAQRRLRRETSKMQQEVKHHPHQEVTAVIKKLFEEHGFLRTHDGRDLYFHSHSVVNMPFQELEIGMGVSFAEEPGEKGPQASSVHVRERRPVAMVRPPKP